MSTSLSDAQRAALDKVWAANPVGRHKLHPTAVEAGIPVTQKQVGEYLRELKPHRVYLTQKKTKPVSVVRRHAPLEMVTVDLVVLPSMPVETTGKGKKQQKLFKRHATVCIDTFSRFVWINELAPMPADAGPTATLHWDAFWPILQDIRTLRGGTNADLRGLQVQCDNGNENLGRFANELKSRNVRITYGKPSAPASQALAERFMGTLKGRLKRWWQSRGEQRTRPWNTDVLQGVVAGYNQSEHSALPKPYTPADVLDTLQGDPGDIAGKVREFQKQQAGKRQPHYEQEWRGDKTPGVLTVGTIVRRRYPQPGKYDTQYGVTLHEVSEVIPGNGIGRPTTYKVTPRGSSLPVPGTYSVRDLQVVPVDAQGQPIDRKPPMADLNLDDTAAREYVPLRIVDERYRGARKQYLVRWRGYPASEATWTPARELAGTQALAAWDAG